MIRKKYRIGVIGLGARAETFVRQLDVGTPDAELFGICDIDENRLKVFCGYCGIENVKTFTNPQGFLTHPDMDAVIITTPDFCHLEPAKIALKAGKHVYIDKPLEVSSERCREIIRQAEQSDAIAFVGFNLREVKARQKIKEIILSGILGQIIHIECMEQLSQAHSASFTRRFHRKKAQSGGLLNTKCSHDMDIMQWYIGHDHKIKKIASFGGTNIFNSRKAPAEHCHECPSDIYTNCPYKDKAGFIFPVGGDKPLHKVDQTDVYGGALCVYNNENELVDNQTVIMEWDNGIRGNFNLQLFQNTGKRETKIWGEKGLLMANIEGDIKVIMSDTGKTMEYDFTSAATEAHTGGHGGSDPKMISKFIRAIENPKASDSGLYYGLAATLVAEKANEAMETGTVIEISPDEYEIQDVQSATTKRINKTRRKVLRNAEIISVV
jgi:Oxidoreductase family, NAD-binding Rossmann fold/Oxidoreductase family, C-terminal alpha/beta domain